MLYRVRYALVGVTLAIFAVPSLLTLRNPFSLGPALGHVTFEAVSDAPFTEAQPHTMPRLAFESADYRDTPRQGCYVLKAPDHAHVFCPMEVDTITSGSGTALKANTYSAVNRQSRPHGLRPNG